MHAYCTITAQSSTTPHWSCMPTVLLCKGHPCTGKSTLATHLAHILRWPLCDKDDAKDCLVESGINAELQEANEAAYNIMFAVAATQLRCGMSVIIDSPCARRALYNRALDLANRVCTHTHTQPTRVPCYFHCATARCTTGAVGSAHQRP